MNRTKAFTRILKKGGLKLLYTTLLLYYAFRRSDLPVWARTIIFGAIGYLLSPIDSIPDLTPILGYTDDLGVLSYALVLIAAYVNGDVRSKARLRLAKLTGEVLDDESIKS
ncbi:MAG: DUF1232 domain-containing protein, partial [Saprospiraceae bacterium]